MVNGLAGRLDYPALSARIELHNQATKSQPTRLGNVLIDQANSRPHFRR